MMKFKKFLAAAMTGVMMFGMVATAVPAVSVYAADEKSVYTIDIDYENFTATVKRTDNADYYVILEVLKDSAGSKVSGTYTYPVREFTIDKSDKPEEGEDEETALQDDNETPSEKVNDGYGAVIDLSFLKATKTSYIRVRGNSESAPTDVKEVNAQQGKIKLKYVSGQMDVKKTANENLAAAFGNGGTKITADDLEKALYQYRTLYGSNFVSLSKLDQAMVEVAGTTIVVRKAAVNTGKEEDKAAASAEVKVKIPAAPKAPKVTIDYAKGTIKLPKNVQVQVIYEDGGWELQKDVFVKVGSDEDAEWVKVAADEIGKYFTFDEESEEVKPADDIAVSSDGTDENEVKSGFDTYVTYTEPSIAQTDWVDAGTASDQEKILALFPVTVISANKAKALVKEGFTLAVRTKAAGKKAASNPAIVSIKEVATVTKDSNQISVTEGNTTATLKWTVTKTGIEYVVTGAPFEYKEGEKWKTLKVGTTTVKGLVTATKTVEVRKAGVKSTKDAEGSFPSEIKPIDIPAYTAPVKSITIAVTETESKKLVAGTAALTLTCTVEVKDEDDKAVTSGIKWTIVKKGETEPTEDITIPNGVVTVAAGTTLTKGDIYVVTATCGGKTSNSLELTVGEASE